MEYVIDILTALLTPVIAVITVYIAYQQWKTYQQRLNLARYERRLQVYEEVKRIIIISFHTKVTFEELESFWKSVSEADFLFGPEIRKYIDEIYTHGLGLIRWKEEYRDVTQIKPEGYDHKKVCDEKDKEISWFANQYEDQTKIAFNPVIQIFKKYLDISS
jgi:hypothetical protein